MANVESSLAKAATPFFIATAVVELGAGVVLLAAPAAVIRLLFGSTVAIFPAVGIARVAGVALLALAAACWWTRADRASAGAKGLVGAMLIYNAGVPLLVLFGSLGTLGPLQWAAVLLHAVLGIWCVRILADPVSPMGRR